MNVKLGLSHRHEEYKEWGVC